MDRSVSASLPRKPLFIVSAGYEAIPRGFDNRTYQLEGNTVKQKPYGIVDQAILSVWHKGMAEAAKNPALKHS